MILSYRPLLLLSKIILCCISSGFQGRKVKGLSKIFSRIFPGVSPSVLLSFLRGRCIFLNRKESHLRQNSGSWHCPLEGPHFITPVGNIILYRSFYFTGSSPCFIRKNLFLQLIPMCHCLLLRNHLSPLCSLRFLLLSNCFPLH